MRSKGGILSYMEGRLKDMRGEEREEREDHFVRRRNGGVSRKGDSLRDEEGRLKDMKGEGRREKTTS